MVISIVRQLKTDDDYAPAGQRTSGTGSGARKIPRGSGRDGPLGLVDALARSGAGDAATRFPGVGLDALKFLHRKRHILFHGHEPLDTDSTPTLEGEPG